MTRQHVQQIVGRRAATPAAANDVLKKLRILIHFAMSWTALDGMAVQVVQGKTGAKLWIPLHASLGEALAAWSKARRHSGDEIWGPFTGKTFGDFVAFRIAGAGLPERCVTRGLRKAAARRLAEAGCSSKEIAAITGHRTLKEIERYTKRPSRRCLPRRRLGA